MSSRKLWTAVAGIVTDLAMVFRLDEGTISTLVGAVVSVASVVAYTWRRGKWTPRASGRAEVVK